MLTPYRSPARPPRDIISAAFVRALCRALPWIGLVLGVLGPLASCSPEDSQRLRLATLSFVTLTGVLGIRLAGAPPRHAAFARQSLAGVFAMHSVAGFISACLLYGHYDARDKALPPVRYVASRAQRLHLPHGTYVRVGDVRVKIIGGATLLVHGAVVRCLPTSGPIDENVMYTPDCEPEAR